ncbi:putative ribonuclease H-like domain-containing protein [Tanacetum coccineum]
MNVTLSAQNEEEVFSDENDDEMPEIRIYDKSSEDPNTPVQTRSSLKKITEPHALVSYIQAHQRSNHKDQQPLFKLQQVWVLVDLAHWRCFSKNRSYQVVFGPCSLWGFIVFQMDVKSAFLYGTIDEEVYVSQPMVWLIPVILQKCTRWSKAFVMDLHKAPRAWRLGHLNFKNLNKLVKGNLVRGLPSKSFKNDHTCVACQKGKQHKASCKAKIDRYVTHPLHTLHMDLFGPTSVRSINHASYCLVITDDCYAVCVCSRFQVTPKTSHLNAVKRIFKYLKGKPNLGLWYPRESPLNLEAFSDSDYGGSNLDRKSTTGGCQFLGQRLISWQCKKQTIVATSTTEAEYVAAANCCGQVLWVQNQLLDYGFNFMNTKIHIDNESTICIVKNPVYHSKTKHIEIRHHFIRDCYEKKLISVEKIHTDLNVADLLTKPFDGPRFNYLVVSIGMINP